MSALKRALRVLAIAAGVMAVSLAFLPGSSNSGPYALTLDDPEGATAVQSCANQACNTACWVDGCKVNCGTTCNKTIKQPNSCPPNTGGCVTRSC